MLHFAEAASAANTRVAYDADWRAFVAWCAERDTTPLPCPPGLLCAYLSSLAKTGLRPSTIGRRASGIGHVHRQHGFEPPTNAEAVKAVLRGIRRELGTARQTKTPATHDLITKMMAACPATLIGIRDRALLALGFAGAFRRSELVALDMADLTEVPDGLRIMIRRSKTDQEGAGQEVAIPRGHHIRPVETLQAWLAAAGITEGPVFRQVTQTGQVSEMALGDDGYVKAIKKRAAAAGLDPAGFSGHSMRAGFLTSAREHGAVDVQAAGGVAAQVGRRAGGIRAAVGPVQRPCWIGLPVIRAQPAGCLISLNSGDHTIRTAAALTDPIGMSSEGPPCLEGCRRFHAGRRRAPKPQRATGWLAAPPTRTEEP